jgi:hypothetical protein
VSLAAEHGFKITNPDLQERIAAERQRLGKPEPVKETAEVREAAPQTQKTQASPAQNPTSSAAATEPKPEAAGKPEAPASKAEASPTAKTEKDSAERPPMVGVLVTVGEGRYKDDPKNDVSQYVDLRTEDGRVHRIWSVQVAKDLKAADAQPGDTVKAQYLGIEHVTKPVPVKDEKTGEVTHREEKAVERGVWRTEVVRQVEKEQSAKPQAQAAKPEAKAAAPETANNAEQQAQRQERDRAEDQRQEQQRRDTERRQTHKPRNRP